MLTRIRSLPFAVCLAILLPAPVLAGNGAPFRAYPMGQNVSGVAIADWNGDGRPDVAASSVSDPALLWRAGDGNGGLGTPNFVAGIGGANEIAAADMQGDGKLDWVMALGTGNSVAVVLNAPGSTTYTFATGTNPAGVAVGDLNHDGFRDVVTANSGGNTVSVLLGNGNGTLKPRVDYGTGTAPLAVAIGDVNNDGHLDVVTSNHSGNNITIWRGTATGILTTRADLAVSGTGPHDLALAHLNGDSNLDIAVAQSGSTVSVFLGTGGGSFGAAVGWAAPTGTNCIVAANLDGDSDIDLAVAGIEGLGRVLQNNGSGQFPSIVDFKCASNAVDIAAGNLNAGGTLDLAVASSLRDVDLLLNNGNATFGVDQTIPVNVAPRGIASAHLNADTSVDIAITDEFNGRVQVMLGNGSGGFGVPANYATGGATLALVLADFNLDGKLDIATANFGVGPNVAILLGNGSGGFGAPTMYQAGAYASALATSDINADGWPDLVVASFGDNNFTVFRNDFGILVSEGTHSTRLAAAGIAFGNFNADSDPDVVVTNNGDASITIYHGDVGAGFSFSANLTVPAAPMGVLAKDFDGNGFADIAVTSSEQQALTVLMNGSGSGIFSFTTYTVGPAWSVIAVDEDQNGTTDLLVPESQNNCVSILHGGAGGPAFFGYPDIILGTGHFPMGVAEGQVYFSGGVAQGFDILTTNNGGGDISVLPFQPPPPPPPPNAPTVSAPVSADLEDGGSLTFTVSAFDIDGDAIASLTAANLPSGATFTPGVGNTTGTFTWVPPSPIQPGDFVVTFTASNALTGSKQTTIHLKPGGTDATGRLLWTPKASDIGAHVVKFRAVNEYGERDSATTTITVTSRLAPPMPSVRTMGAPESPTKGPVISVVPTATISEGSTLELSVSATDTDSLSATTTDLSADNTATFSANGSPIVTCPADVNAPTGVALTINVSATDPDNDAITSLTASTTGLPPGNDATFTPNGQNTQGTFTWTPTASDIGTYGVTFTAVNALVGTAGTIIHVGGTLAGYWKLNGNGLDATQHTDVVPVSGEVYAAGRLGQGLQLNGTTSVGLRGTATASHDASAPFTVECWVNAGALTSIKQTFLEAELNETPAYWAFSVQGNTGRAMVEVRTGVTTAVVVSTLPITGGLFHHVALTYDGALLRLYLNGTLNTSTAFSAGVVVNLGSLNVGGGGSTFPTGLQSGVVDEVRIWREVRSQTQIQATMNQELNGYATGVETTGPVFRDALSQNAPNPFNPSTEIVFEVAQAGRATLRVYDVAGRLVSTLVDADVPAGPVRVRWAGRDAQGRRVRSGVYFYKLEAGRFRAARQMVLVQ